MPSNQHLNSARPWALAVRLAVILAAFAGSPALAQDSQPQQSATAPDKLPVTPETSAWHVQATDILQYYPAFHSAFQGPNSLKSRATSGNTVDATLYAGARPWAGGEIWGNLEMYEGYAPSNTLGVAGYVNGDGAKVGRAHAYARIARLFIRQTVDLGGEADDQEADLNALGQRRTKDRVVITAGKLNVTDVFDTNKYAHDPRGDFLNWSAITAGSFDYAADAWGYTYGAAVEWYRGDWTWRGGLFDLSVVPNNAVLTSDLSQFQLVGEVERRFTVGGRPGAVRLAGFVTRGDMGGYGDAVRLALAAGRPADTALVRRYRSRSGAYVNAEQEIANGFGVFGRLGWDDGSQESYEYTDIDRTAQAGVSLSGARWGRKADTVGAVVVVNQLSAAGQRYLDAGGLGILVGDGRLPRAGDEHIVEAYYAVGLTKGVTLSFDDQLIGNPAYNRDRGPVNLLSLRLHLER